MTTIALAGDTMLGRNVGEALRRSGPAAVFDEDLRAVVAEADLVVVNLECCISDRGSPFPHRVFRFRAPPVATEALALLGVDCVTLANNHALDYGVEALLDTLRLLRAAGITAVGAGRDLAQARAPAAIGVGDASLVVVGVTDDPPQYAATEHRPGTAYADLRGAVPDWLLDLVREQAASGVPVLVTPHWGPNLVPAPVPHVRAVAPQLVDAGASLVAGHSAHVFHGATGRVLFDLGDFVDDYVVDPVLRNDLSLLWLVALDGTAVRRVEAVPVQIRRCRVAVADAAAAALVAGRLRAVCREWGTAVEQQESGRLLLDPRPDAV